MVKKYAPETSQAEATAPIAINSPEVHWKPSKDFALSVCTDRLMRQKLPAEKESGSDLGDQESVNRHRLLMHGLVDFAGSPQVTVVTCSIFQLSWFLYIRVIVIKMEPLKQVK